MRAAPLARRRPSGVGEARHWPRTRSPSPLAAPHRAWLRLPRRDREEPAATRRRLGLRGVSFIVVVLLPIAAAADYYFAIAAEQYAAEFRFTLSTADPPRLGPLSLLSGSTAQSPAALESQVLVQYIASRAIIDDISRSLDLRRLFAAPQADWLSRLSQPAPIEGLVRYWRRQVDPFYDPATGTVTVRVRAFSPVDALRLAQAIDAACEHTVNELSSRARRAALNSAQRQSAEAQRRLADALAAIRAFRDRTGLIDPTKATDMQAALTARLRQQLLGAKATLTMLKTYMHNDSPPVAVVEAQIGALKQQQRRLAARMTRRAGGPVALSDLLGTYEQLQSRRRVAEASYQLALREVGEARAEADRQHVFIASFVPPALPEEATYPRRWRSLGIVALMAFAVWAIGGLALQSVRDHLA